ncbi:MAG: hypothetical protein AMXMBFR78_05200 [Rubrivivax sp.]|jgi:hypothetical protein
MLRALRLAHPCTLLLGVAMLALHLGAAAAASGSASADAAAPPRQRLAEEKAAVEARYEREAAACGQRFAVNDCLDQARRQRRQALAALRAQEQALDAQQRQQRAAERAAESRRRQERIAADQARIRDRMHKRAARGKPVPPLPAAPSPAAATSAEPSAAASAPP